MNHDPVNSELPLILGFVADLMFAVRIEQAANLLGYRVHWIERAEVIAPLEPQAPRRQLAEHLIGPGAALLEQVTRWKPALMIFDLGNADIPWRGWISLLSSVPATRRIPILCYGSHVDADTLKEARSAGATGVVARSRFASDLPGLIEKYARLPDFAAIQAACEEPLSPMAVRGLEEFNRGEYFEAHESLETAWMEDQGTGRELYRAVLQVAVAYFQIRRGNYNGAAKMFLRMRQWIDPLPEVCRGVQIGQLRREAQAAHQELLRLGVDRMDQFDLVLLKPVKYSL
jgi:predicted metal-dependent hydrolase